MGNATITLTDREQFFYDHAGYSYAPDETPEHGRARCAIELAEAERIAFTIKGWEVVWESDPDFDPYCACDDATCTAKTGPAYGAILRNELGAVLGSLWGITFAAGHDFSSDAYARVVSAELASDAL